MQGKGRAKIDQAAGDSMRPAAPRSLTPEQFVEQMLPLIELEKAAEIQQACSLMRLLAGAMHRHHQISIKSCSHACSGDLAMANQGWQHFSGPVAKRLSQASSKLDWVDARAIGCNHVLPAPW